MTPDELRAMDEAAEAAFLDSVIDGIREYVGTIDKETMPGGRRFLALALVASGRPDGSATLRLICNAGDDGAERLLAAGRDEIERRRGSSGDPDRDELHGPGPHFRGGANRDAFAMIRGVASFRDFGGLPGEASLVFSQLLLNIAAHAGRENTDKMIRLFLDAADIPK